MQVLENAPVRVMESMTPSQKAAMLRTAFSSGVRASIWSGVISRKWVLGGTAASNPRIGRCSSVIRARACGGHKR